LFKNIKPLTLGGSMGFSKIFGKAMSVVAGLFAAESLRASKVQESFGLKNPERAERLEKVFGKREGPVYMCAAFGQPMNYSEIAKARALSRRNKGTNRHREGRSG
jgi:hypothetical protein